MVKCTTCQSEIQGTLRGHCQSDWHVYNLKQMMAGKPIASFAEFTNLSKAYDQAVHEISLEKKEFNCKICRKKFKTENSHAAHLNSKKHKELEKLFVVEENETDDAEMSVTMSDVNLKTENHDDEEVVEDDDENDEIIVEAPLTTSDCLFCDAECANEAAALRHMKREHGFSLPFADDIIDRHGMLEDLVEVVDFAHMCVECSHTFVSRRAVQQHMQAREHHRLVLDECMRAFYRDGELPEASDAPLFDTAELEGFDKEEALELRLPSGTVLGHRCLGAIPAAHRTEHRRKQLARGGGATPLLQLQFGPSSVTSATSNGSATMSHLLSMTPSGSSACAAEKRRHVIRVTQAMVNAAARAPKANPHTGKLSVQDGGVLKMIAEKRISRADFVRRGQTAQRQQQQHEQRGRLRLGTAANKLQPHFRQQCPI